MEIGSECTPVEGGTPGRLAFPEKLERLVAQPHVSGGGGIGPDGRAHGLAGCFPQRFVSRGSTADQRHDQVLVLHLRGRGGDVSVYGQGLDIVWEYCVSRQFIHLH
jgi:hypothetical protein